MDKSKNWVDISLEDVADLTVGFVGKTTNHYVNNGIRFLRSQNVEPFRIDLADERFIDESFHRSIKKSQLEAGDVVIVRTGNPGASAVIPEKNEEWNCSDLVIIKPDHTRINSTFLAAFLNLSYGVISSNLVGAVQQHFNVGAAKKLRLKLPSLKEQNIIASYIDSLSEKITINEKINQNLYQQARTIVDAFLCNIEVYKKQYLQDVADCQNGRAFYKEGYDKEGAFVVDLGNVNVSGNFIYTNADKYVSMTRYYDPKLERYRIYKKDLVMVMTDRKSTMDLLGKVGKIYKDGYYLLNQRMYRIRAKEGINTNYLYACLNSTEVSNSLKEKALGSVQKYVNTGEINSIEIKIPPKDEMERIGSVLDPLFTQMENNILENEALTELRDGLLPKLMSGELDVSNIEV